MKKAAVVFIILMMAAMAGDAGAFMKPSPSHMTPAVNPEECSGCHSGIGSRNTSLLRGERDTVCLRCHGSGRGRKAQDIERVFAKPSRHPVYETSIYHSAGEQLPEKFSTVPRHVSCLDCHKSHMSDPEKPWRGTKGYKPSKVRMAAKGTPPLGLSIREAGDEFDLCYLCHSDSANLPPDSRNISAELDPTNMSYHPVEMPGKNRDVTSLVRQLNVNSLLNCGSCHGNNDSNGPRGPHGSDHSPILVAEYRTKDGPEGPKAYELCYMCHDRRSINANDSFAWHNRHVALFGISCYSCHASHGSPNNRHLIDFSALRVGDRVKSLANGIGPYYWPDMPRKPRCLLSCHDATHDYGGVTAKNGITKTWEVLFQQ